MFEFLPGFEIEYLDGKLVVLTYCFPDIYGMSRLISNKLNGLFKKSTYEIKQLIFIKFFKVLAHI